MSAFRFVLLQYPYANWENGETRDLFGKMIRLKLRGYVANHFDGVLPFDTSDFLSDHLLVCKETAEEGLVPFMGYRSMPLSRAEFHKLPFGATTLCQASNGPEHEAAIRAVIEDCRKNSKELYYDSSYTVDPAAKNNPAISPEIKNLILAMHTLHHENMEHCELIAGGNLRFKMERLYQFWGYNGLSLGGRALGPLEMPFYAGDKMMVYHLTRWSPGALDLAATYKLLWRQMLIVGDHTKPDTARRVA